MSILYQYKIFVHCSPFASEASSTKSLVSDINGVLKDSWGLFPDNFISQHILSAGRIVLARLKSECIAFCVVSKKRILQKDILYIEFLAVKRKFQRTGIGKYLFIRTIRSQILRNIFRLVSGRQIDIFFISPNIRVLTLIAKYASFLYPNPYNANASGRISEADDETWQIARKIVACSDNPSRTLHREGLVLEGSYATTPWLIYNNKTAPWHDDKCVNEFAKAYLGYSAATDREFLVRAKIGIFSLLRFIFSK